MTAILPPPAGFPGPPPPVDDPVPALDALEEPPDLSADREKAHGCERERIRSHITLPPTIELLRTVRVSSIIFAAFVSRFSIEFCVAGKMYFYSDFSRPRFERLFGIYATLFGPFRPFFHLAAILMTTPGASRDARPPAEGRRAYDEADMRRGAPSEGGGISAKNSTSSLSRKRRLRKIEKKREKEEHK